jgi:hypothetical protein
MSWKIGSIDDEDHTRHLNKGVIPIDDIQNRICMEIACRTTSRINVARQPSQRRFLDRGRTKEKDRRKSYFVAEGRWGEGVYGWRREEYEGPGRKERTG